MTVGEIRETLNRLYPPTYARQPQVSAVRIIRRDIHNLIEDCGSDCVLGWTIPEGTPPESIIDMDMQKIARRFRALCPDVAAALCIPAPEPTQEELTEILIVGV